MAAASTTGGNGTTDLPQQPKSPQLIEAQGHVLPSWKALILVLVHAWYHTQDLPYSGGISLVHPYYISPIEIGLI